MQKMTQDEFIKKAIKKHGDRYCYDTINFIDRLTKVNITCKLHGNFLQPPVRHLKGQGCPKCATVTKATNARLSVDAVIDKFISIHGRLYDYSKMIYKNTNVPVEIICKVHGSFYQKPHDHLHGTGCPACSVERQSLGTEGFIFASKEVHNMKYDYSNVDYKNNNTKVEIICPEHGSFYQLPSNHLKGSGCPKCSLYSRSFSSRKTPEEFINEANTIHNNKYDYSNTKYITCDKKVEIICPEHGSFFQKAQNHLHLKQGCPKCGYVGYYSEHLFSNIPELKIKPAILYLIHFKHKEESFYKIGITTRSVKNRFGFIHVGYNISSIMEWRMPLYEAFTVEQHIIKKFINYKKIPSRIIGGDSECLDLTKQVVVQLIQEVYNFHNV